MLLVGNLGRIIAFKHGEGEGGGKEFKYLGENSNFWPCKCQSIV